MSGVGTIMLLRLRLLAQAECLDDGTIAFDVNFVEIVEQTATLTYQLSQRTGRDVVLAVLLHVLCQVGDAISEQRNLALGRPCVSCTLAILAEDFFLFSLV